MADTKLGPAVESFVDPAKPAPTEQYVWAPEDECVHLATSGLSRPHDWQIALVLLLCMA